jgi:TatD DNase family protein
MAAVFAIMRECLLIRQSSTRTGDKRDRRHPALVRSTGHSHLASFADANRGNDEILRFRRNHYCLKEAMQLIDIGANLGHESFRHDLPEVLARAQAQGVVQLIVTGASADGSRDAFALAQTHPGLLFATAGVHPHHASDYDADTEILLRELHAKPEIKAVGETGLDYNRDFSPRDAQRFAFERQLQLAIDCGKPLFLHQRDAHEDFIACMDNVKGRVGPAVVHCFTGERAELFDYLDRDFYIGITGWICDERRGSHLRELVKSIPSDRLMLETDAPYLLPRTVRPAPSHRRNEPMYLKHICAEVARDRGEETNVTATNATSTTRTFFSL